MCTRTDFYNALQAFRSPDTPLAEVMHRPVLTVPESDPLASALLTFLRAPIKRHDVLAAHGIDTKLLLLYQRVQFGRLFGAIEPNHIAELNCILGMDRKSEILSRLDGLIAQTMSVLHKTGDPRANAPIRKQLFYLFH